MRRLGIRLSMMLVAVSSALAGCTILHSSLDETSGIPYYLPKSVIVAQVNITKLGSSLNTAGQSQGPYKYFVELDATNVSGNSGPLKTRGDTVADPNHRYFLTYRSNPLYNDRYCISTDDHNLLTSIEYATEDATPRIALALAQLARKGPQAFAAQLAAETVATLTVTFNPYDVSESAAAERAILNALPDNDDARKSIPNVKFHFPGLPRFNGEPTVTCRNDRGVCFRTKIKVPMLLTDGSAHQPGVKIQTGGKTLSSTVMVDVVNVYYTGNFDLDRTFMVEKVVRLGFEQGALTQVIMRKPSEALETVKLPLAVADALLAVPANFAAKATDSAALANTVKSQQDMIDTIQKQLMTGLDAPGAYNTTPYAEKCVGSVNK
jgi:hypothetical protein